MAKVLQVREWVSLVRQFGGTPKRDTVLGVSVTLAAWCSEYPGLAFVSS